MLTSLRPFQRSVSVTTSVCVRPQACQVDLVRDNGHRYFLDVLADPHMPAEHRTMVSLLHALNYMTLLKSMLY